MPRAGASPFDTNFHGTYHGCRWRWNECCRSIGKDLEHSGRRCRPPSTQSIGVWNIQGGCCALDPDIVHRVCGHGVTINAGDAGNDLDGDADVRRRCARPSPHSHWSGDARFWQSAEVPARYVLNILQHEEGSGKTFRLVTPRMFVPRMIGEMLGSGKRNPRPWLARDPAQGTSRRAGLPLLGPHPTPLQLTTMGPGVELPDYQGDTDSHHG